MGLLLCGYLIMHGAQLFILNGLPAPLAFLSSSLDAQLAFLPCVLYSLSADFWDVSYGRTRGRLALSMCPVVWPACQAEPPLAPPCRRSVLRARPAPVTSTLRAFGLVPSL